MSPTPQQLLIVSEVLDAVVSPATRDRILELATRSTETLEETAGDARDFVEGPLSTSLRRVLGEALALEVTRSVLSALRGSLPPPSAERTPPRGPHRSPSNPVRRTTPPLRRPSPARLRLSSQPPAHHSDATDENDPFLEFDVPAHPLTQAPTSQTLPHGTANLLGLDPVSSRNPARLEALTKGSDAPSMPSPSSQRARTRCGPRRLIVATTSDHVLETLGGWLPPDLVTTRVSSVIELLHSLDATEGRCRTLLVVDGRHPSLRPLALAGLADELPASVDVLVWAATDALVAAILGISEKTRDWVFLPESARVDALAARCRRWI